MYLCDVQEIIPKFLSELVSTLVDHSYPCRATTKSRVGRRFLELRIPLAESQVYAAIFALMMVGIIIMP